MGLLDLLFGSKPQMAPKGEFESALQRVGIERWNDYINRFADLPIRIFNRSKVESMAPRVRGQVVAGLSLGKSDRGLSGLGIANAAANQGQARGLGLVDASLSLAERNRSIGMNLARAMRGQQVSQIDSLSSLAQQTTALAAARQAYDRSKRDMFSQALGFGVGMYAGMKGLPNPFSQG